jgi:serine protease Do
MSAHLRAGRTALLVAAGFLACVAATIGLNGQRVEAISFWGEASPTPGSAKPTPAAASQPATGCLPDFTQLAARLSPSVVNISTTSEGETPPQMGPGQDPFGGGDPHQFWEPFERFFGPLPPRPFKQRSLGSGFIINRDGVILTNNHVVENAEEIVVKLANDKEYKAKILGRDAKTDIAVIKIDGASDLTPATLGDSDQLRVGEWVMAIGNPFGLEHSVTAGIVSAKGRYIGQGSYDQFIQTDAAINPGNSGGPLINLRGQVVGINTAIFSRSGGNIGIGFAIPVNLAKDEIPDLEEKGRVTRGWLGVMIQKVTPDIAESLGLPDAQGALVAEVMKDGPAQSAGIKVGDVIVEFDGHPIKDSTDLPMIVARTPIGKVVTVKVIRDKAAQSLSVKIAELKDEEMASVAPQESFGLTVQSLTPEIAESLGLGSDVKGVVVSAVDPGSSADDAGMRRGDVIVEVNRKPVKDMASYRRALEGSGKGKNVLFLVRRGDNTIFLALKPSAK